MHLQDWISKCFWIFVHQVEFSPIRCWSIKVSCLYQICFLTFPQSVFLPYLCTWSMCLNLTKTLFCFWLRGKILFFTDSFIRNVLPDWSSKQAHMEKPLWSQEYTDTWVLQQCIPIIKWLFMCILWKKNLLIIFFSFALFFCPRWLYTIITINTN